MVKNGNFFAKTSASNEILKFWVENFEFRITHENRILDQKWHFLQKQAHLTKNLKSLVENLEFLLINNEFWTKNDHFYRAQRLLENIFVNHIG